MASVTLDPRFRSDEIFNDVNKYFITLKDDDMRIHNEHLQTVLTIFIEHMKKDVMFKACYQRIAYVGSYYEGLKVGKPEEFDLNIIMNLPIDYSALTATIAWERPGYIRLKANLDVLPNLQKHPRWSEYNQIEKWFDPSMHLDQNKYRQWFESVVAKAFRSIEFTSSSNRQATGPQYLLEYKKSGPALILKIHVPDGHTVDVDLVPALEFLTPLPKPFMSRETNKQNWFAVAKPLEGSNNNTLWRPSFYERELEILREKQNIKQVIRQMKKLRDTQQFKSIASYYIKTLFLRELETQIQNSDFQRLPSAFLFYYMLQRLCEACTKNEILDFWNPENNLLGNISKSEMSNISCRLNNIIKAIDRRIANDPYVVAEFILDENELMQLKEVKLNGAMASVFL